jgi:hypothetical protein
MRFADCNFIFGSDAKMLKDVSGLIKCKSFNKLICLKLILMYSIFISTPCRTVFPEKLLVIQLLKKYPAFYDSLLCSQQPKNRTILSQMNPIQPPTVPFGYILILSSHVCLGFPQGLLPPGANQNLLIPASTSKELGYEACVLTSLTPCRFNS